MKFFPIELAFFQDIIVLIITLILVLIFISINFTLKRKGITDQYVTRKLMHLLAGPMQIISFFFYSGEWFTPLREAISAFMTETQQVVTGTVKLKLYKGNISPAGATSPYSLYNESIASFETGDLYDHKDAAGFINLFGLPLKVRAMMKQKAGLL